MLPYHLETSLFYVEMLPVMAMETSRSASQKSMFFELKWSSNIRIPKKKLVGGKKSSATIGELD